jgi:O-antigen/teichoic acid export membrane protein
MNDAQSGDNRAGLSMRLLRGSAFIFGCRVVGAGLTLFAQILLARWMGASQLGIYVLAFSWAILLANLASLGFPSAAIRFVGLSLSRSDSDYVFAFSRYAARVILLAGIAISVCGLAIVWIVFDAESGRRIPLTVAMTILPFMALLHFMGGVANGFSRFGLSFIPTNVARPAMFCIALGVAWLTGVELQAASAMALQFLSVVVVFVPTWLLSRKLISKPRNEAPMRGDQDNWLRTAAALLIATMFTGYFPEIVIIVAGSFVPSDELALLHISFRIAMLVAFGLSAVDAVSSPEIARLYADDDKPGLRRIVNRATRLRFIASLIAVGIFALLGPWILSLFGPEFIAGFQLLMILACGQLVQGLAGPVVRLMSISGHQDRTLIVFAVALVMLVAMIAVLVPVLGVTGAAIAAVIDMVIWTVWMRWLVIRHIGIRPTIF